MLYVIRGLCVFELECVGENMGDMVMGIYVCVGVCVGVFELYVVLVCG